MKKVARSIVSTALRKTVRARQILRACSANPPAMWRAVKNALIDATLPPPYVRYLEGLPSVCPLNVRTDPVHRDMPRLNVLIPGMTMPAMTGGPNTAINLTYRMAAAGIPVRYISTDVPMATDHAPLWRHFSALTGIPQRLSNVEIACGFDRSVPLAIGENDVFFGTAWWTVQMIKHALRITRPQKFLYLIQEFEPGLYPWSTQHALALETYSLDFYGIINERFLAQYLLEHKIGRFAQSSFMERCAVFEPALDRSHFHSMRQRSNVGTKRLLFYARPGSAERNLFELGLYALRCAVTTGVFSGDRWEMLFIGEQIPDMALGGDMVIRSAGWLDYARYAQLVRESDVALSLMLSPHTSYPPLEMAACGGVAITNVFAGKTAEALSKMSSNIVPVEPTLEGVMAGLADAVRRVNADRRVGTIDLPGTWEEAFSDVVPRSIAMYRECLAGAQAELPR
jgi:O-antigen biosynthesis protein